ncbi:MAG: gliding motility-associated C-terminal domain-containing protein [Flavobacteriales bacterium]|nr:gliding motility-associated C-terminal domain-containing protein [Flavobacteriales bacterium]
MRISTYKYLLLVLLSVFIHFKANAQFITIDGANINSCTGSISISVGGGVGPYSYVWSFSPPGDGVTFTDTGLITSSIFNQIPGFYRVVVTDANKDAVTATYQISDSTTITANIKFAGLVCVEDPSSGVIILTFNNGTPPFTWQLLDNNNSSQLVNFGGDLQTNFILINQDTNGDRLGVGDYRFEWSDVNGCSGIIANILITEPAPTNLTINTETGVTCFGGTDGEVNLSVTGGYGANYTVAIVAVGAPEPTLGDYINIGGGGSYTVLNLPTGDYRAYYFDRLSLPPFTTTYGLDVADYNTCQKFEPFTISSPAELLTNISGEILSCFGDTNGNITGTISGGTAPYTITLDQGGSQITVNTDGGTFDFSGLIVGSYNFSIVDAVGCGITAQASITQPDELTTSFDSLTNVMCNNDTTGSITINVTGGTPNYIFDINGSNVIPTSNSGNSYTFGNLGAGNYTITITDQNNCTATNTIIQPLTEPTAIIVNTIGEALSCFGDTDGNITGTISGGAPPYTITLVGGSPIIVNTDGGAFDFSGLSAGIYTFSIVDASGCTTTAQNSITQPAAIPISAIKQDISCFGLTDGILTVPYSTNYTYVLTQLATETPITNSVQGTDLIYTNLSSGNYRLEISGAGNNGAICTVSLIETINEPLEITASSILSLFNSGTGIPINISCNGATDGSIDLIISGGTGSYTYSWTTVDGNIPLGTENNEDISGLVAGTYSVDVSDQNSCKKKPFNFTLNEPRTFTNTVAAQNNICFSGELGSITSQITNNGSVDGITYTYTIISSTSLPLNYPSVQLTTDLTATFTNLPTGDYQVQVKDQNGCSSISSSIRIDGPSSAVAITSVISDFNGFGVSCIGEVDGSISITANGGTPFGTAPFYKVAWIGPNRFVSTLENIKNLEPGTYDLSVTDANGCVLNEQFIITEPLEVSINIDSVNSVSCNGAANANIQITAIGGTGNYTFEWTQNGLPFATTKDISNLTPGEYQVTVTDTNSCFKIEAFTITEPNPLVLTIDSFNNLLCFGDDTAFINVTVNGGTPTEVSPGVFDYQFSWIGPNGFKSISSDISNLIAGTYTLMVTDALGCQVSDNIILTQPNQISIAFIKTDISCYQERDGSIQLSINGGGVAPFTYTWSDLGNGTTRNNLAAGIYTVTVTDAIGCSNTEQIEIIEAPLFEIDSTITNISCFGENDGSIDLNILGGEAPLIVTWQDDASAGLVRNNLIAGIYTVLIEEAGGCAINQSFTINEPALLLLDSSITNATVCDEPNSGAIDLQVTGGSPPFTFQWSNGATTEDLQDIEANDYTVTVIDSQGCQRQATFVVTRQAPIELNLLTSVTVSCENKTVIQRNELIIAGGVAPYSINWSNGTVSGTNGEIMHTGQNSTVIVKVTDSLGCTKELTFDVNLLILGDPDFDFTSISLTQFGNLSIFDPIQFNNRSTGDSISFFWEFGDGTTSQDKNPIHSFSEVGTVTVRLTVYYPHGCAYSYTLTLNILQGYNLIIPTAFTPNGDGINDTIKPVFFGMESVKMSIFDTWGSLIYQEEGLNLIGWDGTVPGNFVENGNYLIIVKATSFNGVKIDKNGPVTLIK